jgi:peptidoglycan/LPS O-acetylase OafA/YrhL
MRGAGTRHFDALDGLRGLAVAAVVVNHLRPNALPGGWLGVDVFFVLSGYLITTLLLDERAGTGRVDLGHFYGRRARRLLPALFVLLAVLAITARLVPDASGFQDLRGDGFSALAYVANWHFAYNGASYFGAFSPSVLRHLWSLSVEEQFYVVWPVVLVVVLRRFGARAVGIVAFTLALASAVAMAAMYGNGAHIARIYFGTDTHAHGVLLGCALAAIEPARRNLPFLRTAALIAFAGVIVGIATLDGTASVAYRGGIACVGALTAVVIAGIVTPAGSGVLGALLSWHPLRALGRISYGVYLWHWPVLVFVTAQRAGFSGWSLLVFQLVLTLALAIASFVLIERPVRAGWPRVRWQWGALPAATALVLALAFVVPQVPAPFAAAQTQARERSADTAAVPVNEVAATKPPPTTPIPRRVVMIGDSVAYTLFPGLRASEPTTHLFFMTAAQTGCPLDIAATAYRPGDGTELAPNLPAHCDWPRIWPAMIDRSRPSVVVALWGLWDLYDHRVNGAWLAVGSPAWHAHMVGVLEHALTIVTAHGARMIVLTTPYVFGYSDARIDALNAIYRDAAARHPGRLIVVDIQPAIARLHPERWDNVHFTVTGADALGAVVAPDIARVAALPIPPPSR